MVERVDRAMENSVVPRPDSEELAQVFIALPQGQVQKCYRDTSWITYASPVRPVARCTESVQNFMTIYLRDRTVATIPHFRVR